jgi:hypothetical protein
MANQEERVTTTEARAGSTPHMAPVCAWHWSRAGNRSVCDHPSRRRLDKSFSNRRVSSSKLDRTFAYASIPIALGPFGFA